MIDIRNWPLVSDQIDYAELQVIISQLDGVLARQTPGDIVELGCYNGTTSLFITRLLHEHNDGRAYHVYDSFAGLPEKHVNDASPAGEQFKVGELKASKQQFIKFFKQAGLPLPIIHRCWFQDITPTMIPKRICFAFLDGDFYESIRDSFQAIESSLQPGSVIIVDDYQSEALPGAKRATDEWLRGRPHQLQITKSLAVIHL